MQYMYCVEKNPNFNYNVYIKTEIKDLKVSNVIKSAFQWIVLLQLKYAKLAMRAD